MNGMLPAWVYEFHPHDWFFVFPVGASIICFGLRRWRFIPTLLIATGVAVTLSLFATMIEIGRPWALIGLTGAFVFLLYLPACLTIGLLLELTGRLLRAPVKG